MNKQKLENALENLQSAAKAMRLAKARWANPGTVNDPDETEDAFRELLERHTTKVSQAVHVFKDCLDEIEGYVL